MSIRVDFERILEMITSISMTPAPQAILETLVGCLVNVLKASMSSSSYEVQAYHDFQKTCEVKELVHYLVIHAVHGGHQALQPLHALLITHLGSGI